MMLTAARVARVWLSSLCLAFVSVGLLSPQTARAEVMQTGGGVIPTQGGNTCRSNASICINENEAAEGGAGDIDAVETATISQETFNPLCELTFRVVARGADYKNTFGWYAVKRDGTGKAIAPELSDLHVFLGCNDAAGVEKTLTIPSDVPEIGFFLANDGGSCVATQDDPLGPTLTMAPSNLFFSQRAFNSDGDGLIHLLVWQSRANANAFYFGWEDLNGGGDNDFEDLLTYVTGIQCTGGGEPCATDGDGVCGDGVTQCRDGELACVATQGPSSEQCNSLDDDCDGETDEGELCPVGMICVRGNCEPRCGTGEFRCDSNQVCVQGVCLEQTCATKDCPAGSVCRDGECVAPCDGVKCPWGEACRNGSCVDACAGVECDPSFVCEPRASQDGETVVGVCTSCGCRGCPQGQSCVEHLCVVDACKDLSCDAGFHCEAGACVDDCDGAVCPAGQLCQAGACIDDPNQNDGNGGAPGGGGSDDGGGVIITPTAGSGNGTGGSSSSGGSGNGNAGAATPGNGTSLEVSGCGCSVPVRGGAGGALAFAAMAVAVAYARRRR
jgi:Domain of unknown function (DUF4114)